MNTAKNEARRHSCDLACKCTDITVASNTKIDYDTELTTARRRKLQTLHNNLLQALREVGPMDREMAVQLYRAASKELGWQKDSVDAIREGFDQLVAIGMIQDTGRRVADDMKVWAAA